MVSAQWFSALFIFDPSNHAMKEPGPTQISNKEWRTTSCPPCSDITVMLGQAKSAAYAKIVQPSEVGTSIIGGAKGAFAAQQLQSTWHAAPILLCINQLWSGQDSFIPRALEFLGFMHPFSPLMRRSVVRGIMDTWPALHPTNGYVYHCLRSTKLAGFLKYCRDMSPLSQYYSAAITTDIFD